jgi:sterol desaturase/sphingolipid hydroxylase (fatty acid hydroxylase superfamily)
MSLPWILFIVLTASGILMAALHFLYASPQTDAYKIYANRPRRLPWPRLARNVVPNTIFSGLLTVGVSLGLRAWLIREGAVELDLPGLLDMGYEIVATLLLYDFLYYLMHRYLFHEWKLLRAVHVVHHTNKYPTSFESLYVHPLENAMGVGLLMICLAVVGPVSLPAFAVILFLYSFLNLVIHSGLDFSRPGLRAVGFMARKHARHHSSMRAGNYASITPLPDWLFGTHE